MIKSKKIKRDIISLLPGLEEKLEKEETIVFAYVFGSYGKGSPGSMSDVDIALYLKPDTDYWGKKMELIGKICSFLDTDEVDLVILNQATLSLQYQVIRTGKVFFSKDEKERIEFETRTIDLYLDAEPLRRINWESFVKRIEQGTYGR